MSQFVQHPLDHTYFRLDWARKRLAELKSVNKVYIDKEAEIIGNSASVNINPESGNPQIRYPADTGHLIPVSFPILVGEISYNLRASLDYLIYRLAILDSGSEQKGTQFPIEDMPENFRGKRNRFLKGVNDTHATAIERLQPYNGVDWTQWLRTISNPDKHRHLSVNRRQRAIRVRYGSNPNPPADSHAEDSLLFLMKLTDSANKCMYVEVEMVLFVVFDDGLPVIKTLENISLKVADTLAVFKPEF
jgi:hypothetical protein